MPAISVAVGMDMVVLPSPRPKRVEEQDLNVQEHASQSFVPEQPQGASSKTKHGATPIYRKKIDTQKVYVGAGPRRS